MIGGQHPDATVGERGFPGGRGGAAPPPPAELRARRQSLNLTQRALAQALDVSRNTVARWERGELTIGNPAMLLLALERLERARGRSAPAPRASQAAFSHAAPLTSLNPPAATFPAVEGREDAAEVIHQRLLHTEARRLAPTDS